LNGQRANQEKKMADIAKEMSA